ncbi:hypothetical protein A9P79_25680 [Cupriavidus taiwanensis]|nr:hypothetical protein A9P79_25680 [Cupriavidus taiwanensis]
MIPAIPHAPARDALVSLAYQWAVDIGIALADDCLPQLVEIPLHVFLAGCADQFRKVVQQAAAEMGQAVPPAELPAAVDAFVAGLLGRLQQYLLAGLADPARVDARAPMHLH